MRYVTIDQFLTQDEISKAVEIYNTDQSNFHRRCVDEIIAPNLKRINADLGQCNDANYLAYVIEHVFTQAGVKP